VTSTIFGIISTSVFLILLRITDKAIGEYPLAISSGLVMKTIIITLIAFGMVGTGFYAIVALYFSMLAVMFIPYGLFTISIGGYVANRLSKLSFIPW